MVVVIFDDHSGVVCRRAKLRERVLGCLTAGRLDRALAAGSAPESSALLAIRASHIVGDKSRRGLADCLGRIVDESSGPEVHPSIRLPVDRVAVRSARREIREVERRLRGPGPLPAVGIARLRLLLADGAGPLYYAHRGGALRAAMASALEGMEPLTGWQG